MPRMRILSASEETHLQQPPVFDSAERKRFFDFLKSLLEIVGRMKGSANQVGFLLMCGYFRAARDFFLPQDFHARDVAYAARLLNVSPSDFQPETYRETTRLRHHRIILDFFGFRPFDREAEALLSAEIATMARAHLKPRLIFGAVSTS